MTGGVFVKTTRRRRGDKTYQYLSLVEAVRDGERTGHRTLLRLGEVSALQASGQLARIVAALQRHLERGHVGVADVEVDVGALSAEAARSVGATAAVATGDRHIDVVTRRNPLQARILDALNVDTAGWDRAHIT